MTPAALTDLALEMAARTDAPAGEIAAALLDATAAIVGSFEDPGIGEALIVQFRHAVSAERLRLEQEAIAP